MPAPTDVGLLQQQLIQVTNEIHRLSWKGAQAKKKANKSIDKALRLSCTTLGDLLIEPAFIALLNSLEGDVSNVVANPLLPAPLPAGFSPAAALLDFLVVEEKLLVQSGMNPAVVDRLIESCKRLIDHPATTGPTLAQLLARLRDAVCTHARDQSRIVRMQTVKGCGLVFGGLAMAGLNKAGLVVTAGLTLPMQVASVTTGVTIAKSNAQAVLNLYHHG